MYIPSSFSVTDRTRLFDFIEQHNFGLVVSQLDHEPFAAHLPLLLDRQTGPFGTLIGHMARANPQWQAADHNVLVVFSGPHAYISPSWYEAENVVPTWNYVAVHVYGTFHLVEQGETTLKILRDLVLLHEKSMPEPWGFQDGDEFINRLAQSIVAFRVEISRIEGKWKLSQNHPRQRREKVIDALAQQPDENSQAIAALMARALQEK
ncbi:MAG: FMN-binding negative transcriptional regulator [Thermoguttaceae bacterium]|jgi:transcriptional regulator